MCYLIFKMYHKGSRFFIKMNIIFYTEELYFMNNILLGKVKDIVGTFIAVLMDRPGSQAS